MYSLHIKGDSFLIRRTSWLHTDRSKEVATVYRNKFASVVFFFFEQHRIPAYVQVLHVDIQDFIIFFISVHFVRISL